MKHPLFLALIVWIFNFALHCQIAYAEGDLAGSKITIIGVSDEISQNIQTHLAVENDMIPFSALGFPRSDHYIVKKTRLALSALGYYSPRISLQGDHQHWQLTIEQGEPVRWLPPQITLTGAALQITEFVDLLAKHPFKPGSIIDHGVYEKFKNSVQNLALTYGFYDAQFKQSQLLVDSVARTAEVRWQFDSGIQYRWGQIDISGTELSNAFLTRYIFIASELPYNQQDLVKTQQSLNRSGYFNYVNIEQKADLDLKTINLTIQLTDIEKYELKTSMGFGTDSGGRFGVNWQDRRFNDHGDKYSLGLNLSQLESTASAQYRQPLTGLKEEWINRIAYRVRDDDLAKSTLVTYDSIYQLNLNEHWSTQWGLTLASEQISQNESIQKNLSYLVPSLRLEYSSVLDPFTAQSGWRWQQDLRLANRNLTNPGFQFIQLEQRIKKILPLSESWRILLRGQLGFTDMSDDEFNRQMPTSYRFFAGGDISVRGYDYQALSPTDIDGKILGGKHLLTASVEVDWRFKDDFRWAIFYDEGNAFNDWDQIQLKAAIGTGFRWITPIGSIRLDYAYSLDEPNDWRWHITIGPDL